MLSPQEARAILTQCGVPLDIDFHALSSAQVDALLERADAHKYRKPKDANGSRGRYWHAYLVRRANSP